MDIIQTTTNDTDFFSKVANFDLWNFLKNAFQFVSDLFNPTSQYAHFWSIAKMVFSLVAMLFILIIAYCIVRLFEIRKKEHEHLHHEIEEYAEKHAKQEKKETEISTNGRWRAVLEYLFSDSEANWKLAIMEADNMLDDLMGDLGFKGDGLGEKLKSADQEKFHQLTSAWEVHTIRNRIAHEGSEFALSNHEAKRIIAIYEDIFQQYGII